MSDTERARKWSGVPPLLFDVDGTLIDSLEPVTRHWQRWAGRHGLDPEHVLEIVHGHRSVEAIAILAPHLDADAEGARIDDEQAADARGVRAMPHAAELLRDLPPSAWSIVTSATRAIARARLSTAGLPMPANAVTAEDVTNGKPAPDGFLEAARRLDVASASCVVIEDTPTGVEAGRRAGMVTIAVTTTHTASALRHADAVIDGLHELLDALRMLRATS